MDERHLEQCSPVLSIRLPYGYGIDIPSGTVAQVPQSHGMKSKANERDGKERIGNSKHALTCSGKRALLGTPSSPHPFILFPISI